MRVFILRYEMWKDDVKHSKCFNTPYSAYFWVDKNRLGMEWVSCHQLCTTVSTVGMIDEKLCFSRGFNADGSLSTRTPWGIPYYEEICEKLGEANAS